MNMKILSLIIIYCYVYNRVVYIDMNCLKRYKVNKSA